MIAEWNDTFLKQVEQQGGFNLALCYQCAKCTAGCPMAYEMDYPPHQIIRAVQLGMRDLVLSSRTIWLCAACETCSTRCPQDVDPAGVMDTLRRISYAERTATFEQDVPLFHRLFLTSVKHWGRVFEVALIGFYNLFSGHLLKDMALAPGMLLKGKLRLLPPRGARNPRLRQMLARVQEREKEGA